MQSHYKKFYGEWTIYRAWLFCLPATVDVEIRRRDGSTLKGKVGEIDWRHNYWPVSSDIMEYRVL